MASAAKPRDYHQPGARGRGAVGSDERDVAVEAVENAVISYEAWQ